MEEKKKVIESSDHNLVVQWNESIAGVQDHDPDLLLHSCLS